MCLLYRICYLSLIFFFKQKTAYDLRISDWSSDVCSSDLLVLGRRGRSWRGLFGGEHPLYASAGSVALSLPGSDLAFELRAIVDATVQALAPPAPDLDPRHFAPAAVLRREVELQPAQAAIGLLRGVGLEIGRASRRGR